MEKDDEHRVLLVQQHADSVRYLNELNSVSVIHNKIRVSDDRGEVVGKLCQTRNIAN